MDTQPAAQDPYAFITDPKKMPKKGLLPAGNSKKNRLLIVAGGVFGLALVGVGIMAILNNIGSAEKKEWLSLAQEQQELIRISDLGSDRAQNRETKNLAITTKLTLMSSQDTINKIAKNNGAVVSTKTLALGKDTKVDAALKTAEQTNQFDKVFAEILKAKLIAYQAHMKKLYDGSTGKTTKASLSSAFTSAGILAAEANK